MKKKRLVFQVFLLICMLIGLLITLYPFYSDSLNGFIDQKRIEQAQQISIKKKEKLKVQMQEENQQKVEAGLAPGVDPFDNQLTDTHSSAQLIGAVNIPKINVNVALYDTLNQRVLEKGAGVLQGTSFPLGGVPSHSVISAHSGLSTRRLFTDLGKLKKEDLFILTVLGEKLAYKVSTIQVVEPDDTSGIKLENGKDIVTLLTCTPYMINSHRLLVTGERVPYNEEVQAIENDGARKSQLIHLLILLGVALLVGMIIYSIFRTVYRFLLKKRLFDFTFILTDKKGTPIGNQRFCVKKKKAVLQHGVPLEGVTNEEGQLTFTQLKGDSYWLVPMEKPNQRVKFGVTRLNQQQMLFIKRHKRIRTLDNEANRYQIKE
ncbi:class C sortase [Enterococcus durans]|uniref:class C sortase n=2 Tax=Enterococcus durans TaxID=53345 RepID=UPI00046E4E93|nr:class C sortase [Enterococcus durans]QCJ65087.1 class C sortase [Lactobacillus sp. Koumiss]AKX85632.1 peptidase C60 [Enterococcus durans]KST47263.1 peptidase C60 [Enterococcus durans]MBS5930873.1 class C sortase [Enterococcus durans]MCA6743735.1 class C sortase [Enterococcus durans]